MKAGRAAAFGRAVPGRRLCLSIVVSTPARAARRRPAPSLAPSEATRFPDTRALPGACETLETMTFDKTLSPSQRDARLNAYLRVTAPQGRVALRTGPFLATFDPRRDNPYRNYAVPDDGADPPPAEIEAFAEICRAHGRRPRLEYAPEAAPALEAALVATGFAPEFRPPFLTCAPARLREVPPPEGFRIASAEALAELAQCAAVLTDAYAEHGFDSDGDAGEMLKMNETDRTSNKTEETAGGEAAGCGMFT